MGTAKIEFKLGGFSFASEGEEVWVAKQLDKILEKAPQLQKLAPEELKPTANHPNVTHSDLGNTTLASFIKSSKAGNTDNGRFLTTAVWLQLKGSSSLTTNDVTKALNGNKQSKVGNSSECLNQNVKKGFCEKNGKQFYVTEEGISNVNGLIK